MNDFFDRINNSISEIYYCEYNDIKKVHQFDYWKSHIEDLIKFYYSLNDDESKEIYVKLFKLHMGYSLSHSKVDKYSLFPQEYWNKLEIEAHKNIDFSVPNDYLLDRIETFLLRGYEYKNICKAKKGDIVLDCGAYTGNTSVYFSNLVGDNGKVFSFEAMPQTYNKLINNISNYNNIYAYNYAICEQEKKLNFTQEATPGSRVCNDCNNSITVQGISIDLFAKKHKLEKVDFIKMDIEGSELKALDGCIETCKKFLPTLAISIYHKPEDWIAIPKKILEFNKNYKFYMKHNSRKLHETVLFAVYSTEQKKDVDIDHDEAKNLLKILNRIEYVYYFKRLLMYIAYYGLTKTIKSAPKKLFFYLKNRVIKKQSKNYSEEY